MLLKKYVKNRRKLKILLLLMLIGLIVITIIVLSSAQNAKSIERLLDDRFIARAYGHSSVGRNGVQQRPTLLKSPKENGIIVPEKYDEHAIKARIIAQKIAAIKEHQQQQQRIDERGEEAHTKLDVVSTGVHIFYSAPVAWYKSKKPALPMAAVLSPARQALGVSAELELMLTHTTPKPIKILNTAFYPALGLYKPTSKLLEQHFDNIRNCGIGVLILSYTGKSNELDIYRQIIELVPNFNLTVTFELSVAGNQSIEYLRQQINTVKTQFHELPGFYKVYSQTRGKWLPVLYVSNAYKLSETMAHQMCATQPGSLRRIMDAYLIGHIRLKAHADIMRRLCFDGYYSKLPSNGATYASTWKNWSYLKSFALTYKMLFVPTVGPGYAERNKFPRHGDIQRHRSNGRYYGVAWRTAILNHVGFINIASYNNWPEGSQIEEVIPKAGFLDYNPGSKTKYLDLTTHWVGNFLKTRQEAAAGGAQLSCYELLNNTIC